MEKTSLFRDIAIRRYAEASEESVVLELGVPRTFVVWCIVTALLLGSVLAISCFPIPVYSSSLLIIVGPEFHAADEPTGAVGLLVVTSAEHFKDLKLGRRIAFTLSGQSKRLTATITFVAPNYFRPETLVERFHLSPKIASRFSGPVAVSYARLTSGNVAIPTVSYSDSVYDCQIETGSQPLIYLFPWIGRHFRND
jgi:hypothetical protein